MIVLPTHLPGMSEAAFWTVCVSAIPQAER
jgi:hypothetical protein